MMENPGRGTATPAPVLEEALAVHLYFVPPSLQLKVAVSASTPSVEMLRTLESGKMATQTLPAAEAKLTILVNLSAMWTVTLTAGTRGQPGAREDAFRRLLVTTIFLLILVLTLANSCKNKA